MPTNTQFIAQNQLALPLNRIYCTTWKCGPAYIYTIISEYPVTSNLRIGVTALSGTFVDNVGLEKGKRDLFYDGRINYAENFIIGMISPAQDETYRYVAVQGMPPFDISDMYNVITLSLFAYTSDNTLFANFSLDKSWRQGQWVLPYNFRDGSMAGKNEEIYWSSGIRNITEKQVGGSEPVTILEYDPFPERTSSFWGIPPVAFIITEK